MPVMYSLMAWFPSSTHISVRNHTHRHDRKDQCPLSARARLIPPSRKERLPVNNSIIHGTPANVWGQVAHPAQNTAEAPGRTVDALEARSIEVRELVWPSFADNG